MIKYICNVYADLYDLILSILNNKPKNATSTSYALCNHLMSIGHKVMVVFSSSNVTYSADTIPLILVSFLSILFGPLRFTENLGNTV